MKFRTEKPKLIFKFVLSQAIIPKKRKNSLVQSLTERTIKKHPNLYLLKVQARIPKKKKKFQLEY